MSAQRSKPVKQATDDRPPVRRRFPAKLTIGIATVLAVLILLGQLVIADWLVCLPEDATATYVGRQGCIQCHSKEVEDWSGSFHDLAMDLATPETVLGDFDNAELTHYGITSRMFRRDGKYMIHTEGPDGSMQDFEIKYVFGVDPLQQYMVEFDRTENQPADEVGRVQVLRVSWDTQRERWFYLPPPDVDEKLSPDDDLHWTGVAQRWNNMCADCHSTNLRKAFDARTNTYHTTFSEIDVSCETCHGPASLHVELAERKWFFWDRKRDYGLARLKSEDPKVEIQACAPCHSRRRVICPQGLPGENYYDNYANELLEGHTYYADGQILDEVYVYGSFIQSKMYHKEIRCSDCHDPHTTRTKYEGNLVCTSCHQHPAGKYDIVAHHRHQTDSQGALCVECHMPETTYMEVDPRRDHSLRVPRPDLSVRLGTPNACSRCHLEEGKLDPEKASQLEEYSDWLTAARGGDTEVQQALQRVDQWCADKFTEWYGEKDDVETHYAHTLAAARRGDAEAEVDLIHLATSRSVRDYLGKPVQLSAIVRATGLHELSHYGSQRAIEACLQLLSDDDPQVRAAAIANLQPLPNDQLVKAVAPLLTDPVRSVRTEAARVMARVSMRDLKGSQRQALESALDEFKVGLMVSNDRGAAHLNLGVLYESLGDSDAARAAYETALHVEPQMTGPRSNLAALHDRLADEAEQRSTWLARNAQPEEAAKAAAQVEEHREKASQLRREELGRLARDARLAPGVAAVRYRYGLLLYLHDRFEEAEEHLRAAVDLEPNTPDFVLALALFLQRQERFEDAYELARHLVELRPGDATYVQILNEIRQQAAQASDDSR